jgi:AcrR family transcriptional regulator
MVVAERKRLTAQDWTGAALEALAYGGLAAVAVEPLAARLGATKGSFYWHFANRDALIEATLLHWERTATEDVITLVDTEPDVPRRLRTLLAAALGMHPRWPPLPVELALQATARHPLVEPVLARVTGRRVGYLTDQFAALGFPPDEAHRRGLLVYTAYLGHAQLVHATPDIAPSGDALPAYVEAVVAALSARQPDGSSHDHDR